MLQLYPANQTNFEWNGEPIHHSYDEHVERDEAFLLKFKVLLDDEKEYKAIKKGMVVKADTPDGAQPFRIWDITKASDHLDVEALHVLYDLDTKLTNPIHVNNGFLGGALEQFKAGLPKEMATFEFSTGISKQRTYNTEDLEREHIKYNALDVFLGGAHSIVGTWEAELLINGWDIRLVESLGKRTGALLYEKKNISKFEEEGSNKGLCTRIYAESTFRPERQEGSSDTPEEIHISVVVDSPLIGVYEQVHEKHYVNNEIRTEEELRKWAKRKFTYEHIDLPKRTIKVDTNIIDGTEINYGDYLVLKYIKHDVDEEIRCVGYDYDPIANLFYSITLGSNPETMAGKINGTIQDLTEQQLSNEMLKVAEEVTRVQMMANGFNRASYGPEPVPNPIEGDTWYQYEFSTPNDVTLYIWNGERWELIVDDFTGERVREEITKIDNQTATLAKSITASNKRIDSIISDRGLIASAEERAKQYADQKASEAQTQAVTEAEAIAQRAIGTAGTYTDTKIKQFDDGLGLRVEQVIKQGMDVSVDTSNIVGWSDFQARVDSIAGSVNQMQGDQYKQAQTQLTLDAISNQLTQSSGGAVTNFSSLIQRIDSVEGMVADEDSIARAIMTSESFKTEVNNQAEAKIQEELKSQTKNVLGFALVKEWLANDKILYGKKRPLRNENISNLEPGFYRVEYDVLTSEFSPTIPGEGVIHTELGGVKGGDVIIYHGLGKETPYTYTSYVVIGTDQKTTPSLDVTYTLEEKDKSYLWGYLKAVRLYKQISTRIPVLENAGSIRSEITQLYNAINLNLLGQEGALSRIAMNEEGVHIKGNIIHLDGNVSMDNAFVKSLMVDNMTADTITAQTVRFADAIGNNLDINSISGNKAQFIEALFNGQYSKLKITGDYVNIVDNLGRTSSRFTDNSLDMFADGVKVGALDYRFDRKRGSINSELYGKNAVILVAEPDSFVSLGFFRNKWTTTATRALSVAGATGNIYLSAPIFPEEGVNHALNISWGTINGVGSGIRLMNQDGSGGIQIMPGDAWFLDGGGWTSLSRGIRGYYG